MLQMNHGASQLRGVNAQKKIQNSDRNQWPGMLHLTPDESSMGSVRQNVCSKSKKRKKSRFLNFEKKRKKR